jgi:hypothetical protein
MENDEADVQIATRVDRTIYAKIVARQEEAKKLTGLEPSISAMVRVMLAEAPEAKGKKR